MKTFEITFPYDVQYDGNYKFSEMIKVKLSEKEILEAAELFRKNGGFPVEFCALEKITDKVYDLIFTDDLLDHFDEDCDFDLVSVELYPEMPEELRDAIESYIDTKDVNLGYYSEENGKTTRDSKVVTISKEAFKAMLAIVELSRNDKPDFELLKGLFPDLYEQVAALSPAGSELREFPFEVYETF